MDQDTVLGIVRHVLTTAGGGLIANGAVTGAQWQDVVGGIVALIAVGWSILQKRNEAAKLAAVKAGA